MSIRAAFVGLICSTGLLVIVGVYAPSFAFSKLWRRVIIIGSNWLADFSCWTSSWLLDGDGADDESDAGLGYGRMGSELLL